MIKQFRANQGVLLAGAVAYYTLLSLVPLLILILMALAIAYLAHPLIGGRLRECTALIRAVKGRTISDILGNPDDLKFRSSMTLFDVVDANSEFSVLGWRRTLKMTAAAENFTRILTDRRVRLNNGASINAGGQSCPPPNN